MSKFKHKSFRLYLQVNVYQLLDITKVNISQGKKLVSSRLIPIHSNGWEVFTITQAVSKILPLILPLKEVRS